MQFKPLPAPPADEPLVTLDAVRTALPATPDPELDCCARVMAITTIETRDAAADWLTFCRALELAAEESTGYRRNPIDGTLDPECLANAFRSRVVGAAVVLDAIETADEPLPPTAVFAHLDEGGGIPRTARRRHGDDLTEHWTDRIDRLLGWAAAFGLVERVEGGYRLAE
ncbi:hypothetical protein [Halovivax cerinus]|uniref:Uncharacterized protein n=1 Tax=Halovivax cerinus TaxID=1487865 RepID=A0ABD5NNH3_9EURY|nr:hypothetical protein [Halovivax cerinus]